MAGDDGSDLNGLTRALLVSVSLGTISLTQVGCAIPGVGPTATRQELCEQALRSGDARDVDRLIRRYPGADCIAPTLAALPPQTLSRISPAALDRLPATVRRQIPPQTAIYLRFPPAQQNDTSSGGSGGGPY
jgi:hypothetical protein